MFWYKNMVCQKLEIFKKSSFYPLFFTNSIMINCQFFDVFEITRTNDSLILIFFLKKLEQKVF